MSDRTGLIKSRAVINIFAKSPIPGTVKTRMRPPLSVEECLELYLALVRHTVEVVRSLDSPDIEKFVFLTGSPEDASRYAMELGISEDVRIEIQSDGDLGNRMIHALEKQFRDGFLKVLFIGTDSPLLKAEDLEAAIEELTEHPVVIGPTEDGGYYLIGFSACLPSILRGIEWGSPLVYLQTLELLERHGLPWKRLKEGFDVDNFEDLTRLHTLIQAQLRLFVGETGQELLDAVNQLLERSKH